MPVQKRLSDKDIAVMQSLYDSDQHHLAYSYYAFITGSEQAAFQSQISDPNTRYGQIAMEANALAQRDIERNILSGAYPPNGLHDFSREIFRDFFDKVKTDVNSGGTGILSDQEITARASRVWENKGIGDYFPGNLLTGRLNTPGAMNALEASITWYMPWKDIQEPKRSQFPSIWESSPDLMDASQSTDFNWTAFSTNEGRDYNETAFSTSGGLDFNWTAFSGGGQPSGAASSPFDLKISDYSRWFD